MIYEVDSLNQFADIRWELAQTAQFCTKQSLGLSVHIRMFLFHETRHAARYFTGGKYKLGAWRQ
jgi:hypothetical protein